MPKELSLPIDDQVAVSWYWNLIDGSRSLALGLMLIMPRLHRDVTGLHVDVVLASDFPTFFSSAGLLRVR